MIYILFAISLVIYLSLKIGRTYYEYFSIPISPKNDEDNLYHAKRSLPWLQIVLASFIKSRKPNWTITNTKTVERKLSIIKSLCHFIFIFCIVSFIFCLLQLWLDNSTKIDIAQATILKIEETQFKIKNFVSHFKIGFAYDIAIGILLTTLASLFPLLEKHKAKDKIKKYNKAIKSILYFLTISTSFTFFGNRFASEEEGTVGKLEIHKLQILEGNKLLLKKINDAVTDKVINEIIGNAEIEKVLDKIEEVKKSIEEAKKDDDYKNFVSIAPPIFVNNLPLKNFELNYNGKYDFGNYFEKAESKFQDAYSKNSTTQSDFYRAKQENGYASFQESNHSWFNEKECTENSAKQAEETFIKASEASEAKYSKYYSKYNEPIEKLIKKGYSKTGGKWIKSFFELLGVDLPFLDELIDPIINEPIEDYITKKTANIFRNCTENKTEAVETELRNCSVEFKDAFNSKVNSSRKFSKLREHILTDLESSRQISSLTKSEIQMQMRNADAHLFSLCSNSKYHFEHVRKDFLDRLNSNDFPEGFSGKQIENFKEVLDNWNDYKETNKLKWYFNSVKEIESEFFNYSESNGNIKATWGFILQQQDWDRAVNYYTNIHPDGTATGKPYYLLKYYYSSIGKEDQFSDLYDNATEDGVGAMCPH